MGGILSPGTTSILSNGGLPELLPKTTTPISLLVESLIEQLCAMLEPDLTRSKKLYKEICERLHRMNLIDESYKMSEFEVIRSQYQKALYQLVAVSRGQNVPASLENIWPLTQPIGLEWSRYHREFEEVEFIAEGGFGKVYRSLHKLDGIEYAIKKVVIKADIIQKIFSHFTEVKTLASLSHTNIVPYKTGKCTYMFSSCK
jgi:eukaryotic translation initiation factor 2-alpha kinase 1